MAIGLLVGLWALGSVRRPSGETWVHSAGVARGPVRILQFYSTVGYLKAGQKAQLCYSVENAKMVRIAPLMVASLPSTNRCLEIVPLHTTHYTIVAEGFDGHVVMQSLTLPVDVMPGAPPRPLEYSTNWDGSAETTWRAN